MRAERPGERWRAASGRRFDRRTASMRRPHCGGTAVLGSGAIPAGCVGSLAPRPGG